MVCSIISISVEYIFYLLFFRWQTFQLYKYNFLFYRGSSISIFKKGIQKIERAIFLTVFQHGRFKFIGTFFDAVQAIFHDLKHFLPDNGLAGVEFAGEVEKGAGGI